MRKLWHLSWLIGLALIMTIQPPSTSQAGSHCLGGYAPGVVLVGFRDGVSATEQWTGLNVIATIPGIDVATLHVSVGQECAALEMLRRDPRLAFAELDYTVHATEPRFLPETGVLTPNDPGWASQWGPAKIGAPAAWNVTIGTPDVVIAVLDTGVRLGHEDLNDNLWINPGETPDNGIDDDGNGKVDDFWGWHFYHKWAWDGEKYTYLPWEDNQVADDNGHGTHVAGITGAEINNDVGIAGMAGGSRLMTIKMLNQYGDGWYSDLAQGIVYAVDNGAKVINISLGGKPSSETLQEAVDYAYIHGVLVVAASGNSGGVVLYPAACEHVLTVAATDQNDARASFSNHGLQVDVAAPGVDIYSTWWRLGGYFTRSGTSMAAPHISGLAALIWSARPDLTVNQVTGIITSTAADVNSDTYPGWDEYLGWGRVEAGRALSATVHAGNLHLAASRPQLSVGEVVIITATVPVTARTLVTFTASSGAIFPETTALANGVATTTLVASPSPGMIVITGTTETLNGSLFLRLLPGSVVSATLTPSSWEATSGDSVSVTLTAADSFGNPPLDGTPINWVTSGGTIAPVRSSFYNGEGQAMFTAGSVYESAVITASLGAGSVIITTTMMITFDVPPPPHHHHHYLPVILHNDRD